MKNRNFDSANFVTKSIFTKNFGQKIQNFDRKNRIFEAT